MADGALDVVWTTGVGKKNRPSGELRALGERTTQEERLRRVQASIFGNTHTLGLRRTLVERLFLPRAAASAETAYGSLKAKSYRLGGASYTRIEHDELARASRASGHGLPGLFSVDSED